MTFMPYLLPTIRLLNKQIKVVVINCISNGRHQNIHIKRGLMQCNICHKRRPSESLVSSTCARQQGRFHGN